MHKKYFVAPNVVNISWTHPTPEMVQYYELIIGNNTIAKVRKTEEILILDHCSVILTIIPVDICDIHGTPKMVPMCCSPSNGK